MVSEKDNTITKQKGLTRQQKESVFLLSIGTFLEYFDLMLYMHMAVLLNELFFPQADPAVAKMLGAFAFASTYMFRPIGGFIIGIIGDRIGRKKTVMITTFTMAACCLTMAALPTYAEIGITATVVMIFCRALQGFSSMGEVTGAKLYVMESFKQPYRYIFCALISLQYLVGIILALLVASFALSIDTPLGWRLAFMIGAVIAVVGLAARTRLRETPEFVDYTRRLKMKKAVMFFPKKDEFKYDSQKVNLKTAFFLLMQWPTSGVSYCSAYFYAGEFMKESLGFTPEQVINQNLKLSILSIFIYLITITASRKYHPAKIAKVYTTIALCYLPFIPYLFNTVDSVFRLTVLQLMLIIPLLCFNCSDVVFFRHFPVTKRFKCVAIIFGFGSLFVAIMPTLFIFLKSHFGHYGLLFIFIPAVTLQFFALNYIKKLEQAKGCYSDYPEVRIKSTEYQGDYNFKSPELYAKYDIECKYSTMLLNKLVGTKTIDQRLVEKAMVFCKKWHDGQFRKSGEEYYTHPFTVADMVVEYIPSTDVVIGALLHDLVEDTECTLELIKEEFNERVAQIVQRLTRIKTDENGNKVKVSVEELISEMKKADDQEALLIKEIDRLHIRKILPTINSVDEQYNSNIMPWRNNLTSKIIY
jgi:MHS family proline/betaine transporter-like MFS transporter